MLYWSIARFNFLRFLAYPTELAAIILRRFLEVGTFVLFWYVIAASSNGRISTSGLVGYFLVSSSVAAFTNIIQMRLAQRINQSIKNGSLSNYLVKPLPAVGFLLAESVGQLGPVYLVATVTLGIGIVLAPPLGPLNVLMFLAYLAVALVISFAMNVLMGTISLYTVEGGSIRHCTSHVMRLLSGILAPLTFFPDWLRRIAEATPFPSVVFGPTTALTHPDQIATQLPGLAWGAAWAALLLWLSLSYWNRSLRAYDAVGI